MQVTRKQIQDICQPGDVIAVEYLSRNAVAVGILFAEEGRASHALCCLGGLDIVEATATGVAETNLHNYLRGNCRLTVRTTNPAPTEDQAKKATDFWLERVNDPYDWGMIVGSVFVLFARDVIGLFSKRAGTWVLEHVPNFLASSNISTCAELAIRGVHTFCYIALSKYPVTIVNPEILRTDPSLETKAVLNAAVLID